MIQRPDTNTPNTGSLAGGIRDVLSKWLRNDVDDMVPAKVVSYNRATNRAVIRPLVMVGTTDGSKISRASIPNIKVFRFGGGGYFISFPLQPGDFGWLKANDRDISLVMQSKGGEDWPNTERLHSFSDAMFFPDTIKDWIIGEGDASSAVFQSLDGNAVFSLSSDSIEIRVGSQTLRLDSSGFTHNSINIGDTHAHGGSPTAPDGPVSNTGQPI